MAAVGVNGLIIPMVIASRPNGIFQEFISFHESFHCDKPV